MPTERRPALARRRRGSLGLETLLVLPVAVVIILLARFILDSMLTRHDVAVYTRGGVVTAAALDRTDPVTCNQFGRTLDDREGVDRTAVASCADREAEGGLSSQQPFFRALRDGASAWPDILRDIDPRRAEQDIRASAIGTVTFTRPPFSETGTPEATRDVQLRPRQDFWDHDEARLANGHDAVVWQELSRKGTYRLFPDVFPARSR